ncbi:MAG: OmpH family outer membrane protein [Oligoflexales bacterium]
MIRCALALVALCSSVPGKSVAQPKAQKKFAVVDMQAIILNVSEGKDAKNNLEKEIKAKEAQLNKQKQELEELNKNWQQQAPLLSNEARAKKQQEFQEKYMNLRNEEMNFQADIKQKEQKATQKIAVNVTQLVEKLSKDRGYEMVFETSSAGLLYLKDPDDLTKEVIAAYEEQSKSGKDSDKSAKK